MKKSTVITIIAIMIIYLIVGIIIPFILKCTLFNSTSTDGWASFLGSYIGGVLGGLGTLIAMYMTIKQAIDMQTDNKKDSDQRMLDEIQRRNDEYKRDKADRQKEQRREFADSIAELIGQYITDISKYHYASLVAESLLKRLQNARDELNRKRQDYFSPDNSANIHTEERALQEYYIAKERYDEVKAEYDENSKFGKRLAANEAFFTIKSKLSGIKEAEKMIELMETIHDGSGSYHQEASYGSWITCKCDLLIDEYQLFREKYINQS